MKKLLLIDLNNLAWRWYFALVKNPLKANGINTSAIHGVLSSTVQLMKEHGCEYVGMCGECKDQSFRKQACTSYKEGRRPMPDDMLVSLQHLERLCPALNMPILRVSGAEADDVLGSLATTASEQGFTVLILTNDKDLTQLCNDHIWVLRPKIGGGFVQMGVQEVCQEWQINEPKQLIDILALMGDSTDGYAGVPGVGKKTASKLIAAYGTAQAVYHNRYSLTDKLCSRIEQHKSDIALCKWLATIRCDLQEFLPTIDALLWEPPSDLAVLDEYRLNKVKELILGKQSTGMYRG